LHDVHHRLGAQAIDFGGWALPVKFSGIVEEHRTVRQTAGAFDISHMGEIWVRDVYASEFLNHVLTNDIKLLSPGRAQYSLMCNDEGGVIDDLYVYQLGSDTYMLMVNASRIEEDMAWLCEKLESWPRRKQVSLMNESEHFGAIAVQGPAVSGFIDDVFNDAGMIVADCASELKKNEVDAFVFERENIFVSRTGYTGEDGFEVVAPVTCIEGIWEKIMKAGSTSGIKPCGLGSRDTLRMEMCYPLYGHELNEEFTPVEAGLGYFVKLDKDDFIGRESLLKQKEEGPAQRLSAFKIKGKFPPPRADYTIWGKDTLWHTDDRSMVGKVTSGTLSPSLGVGIGMGYISSDHSSVDTKIEVNIRSNFVPAVVVKKPIYKK